MSEINIDQLASEIANGLAEYSQSVVTRVNISSAQIAKSAVKKLKATSPKLYGDYGKGWRQKEDKYSGQPNNHTVYNATNYQLTHLLENGHAKSGGGRVEAIPHIKPVEDEVIKDFMSQVEGDIANG